MATTYLDLTNEVLRELNEIPLTAANFATATGLQKFVKDTVNKSISLKVAFLLTTLSKILHIQPDPSLHGVH